MAPCKPDGGEQSLVLLDLRRSIRHSTTHDDLLIRSLSNLLRRTEQSLKPCLDQKILGRGRGERGQGKGMEVRRDFVSAVTTRENNKVNGSRKAPSASAAASGPGFCILTSEYYF